MDSSVISYLRVPSDGFRRPLEGFEIHLQRDGADGGDGRVLHVEACNCAFMYPMGQVTVNQQIHKTLSDDAVSPSPSSYRLTPEKKRLKLILTISLY